jgi:hypothetical protein
MRLGILSDPYSACNVQHKWCQASSLTQIRKYFLDHNGPTKPSREVALLSLGIAKNAETTKPQAHLPDSEAIQCHDHPDRLIWQGRPSASSRAPEAGTLARLSQKSRSSQTNPLCSIYKDHFQSIGHSSNTTWSQFQCKKKGSNNSTCIQVFGQRRDPRLAQIRYQRA